MSVEPGVLSECPPRAGCMTQASLGMANQWPVYLEPDAWTKTRLDTSLKERRQRASGWNVLHDPAVLLPGEPGFCARKLLSPGKLRPLQD